MDFAIVFLIIFLFLFLLVFYILRLFPVVWPLLFWGPIYVPTNQAQVKRIIEIANIKPEFRIADLGSGDGRLVIALAKRGAEVHGYEVNPMLVRLARKNIRKENVADKAFIHWKNFWTEDFSSFDIITIYGMSHVMRKLEKKLKKEMKKGAMVVSNAFEFPSWPPYKKENNVYLYIK